VSGRALAVELSVSLRTVYRDIATLQGQGAGIDGEPGLGYVLRPGFMLPPLMFSDEEIEALVLGSRWVAVQGDARLAAAARDAFAKIAAILPPARRDEADSAPLLVAPGAPAPVGDTGLATIRDAIRAQHKLAIAYLDRDGNETRRTVWPFAVGFFDRVRILAAWCELRQAFRHFRTDRIVALTPTGARYPLRRQTLLKEWRAAEGIPQP
jgi:predicted DNA-binding transcriptional regulator YafY